MLETEIAKLTEAIIALNVTLAAQRNETVEQPKPKKEKAPKPEPAPEAPPVTGNTVPTPEPVKAVTIEDLRAVGSELVKLGKGAAFKAVLSTFGAEKLSAVPTDKYAELHAKLQETLNAK